MKLTLAAILSGTDPVAPLPPATFHRTLEEPILCPKCDAAYNLVVDYDQATGRFFQRDSDVLIRMLRKAIMLGHGNGHRVTHFETSGVVVKSHTKPEPPEPQPLPRHIM
jgi:hypothetical protein